MAKEEVNTELENLRNSEKHYRILMDRIIIWTGPCLPVTVWGSTLSAWRRPERGRTWRFG